MRYRCRNCRIEHGAYHDFEADEPICPECDEGPPMVYALHPIHLVVPDRQNGPITGHHGRRWRYVCEPECDERMMNREYGRSQYTDDPRAATCVKCLGSKEAKERLAKEKA